jgi:UTP--glucose-1-phosphate uridylyltransferase
METSIQYGLRHPETKDALRKYIIDLGKKLESEGKKKPAGK